MRRKYNGVLVLHPDNKSWVSSVGSNPARCAKFMLLNGLRVGFEAKRRQVRFLLGAPSYVVSLETTAVPVCK